MYVRWQHWHVKSKSVVVRLSIVVLVVVWSRSLGPAPRRIGDRRMREVSWMWVRHHLLRHEHGLVDILNDLAACARAMRWLLLLLKRLVMRASGPEGHVGLCSMVKRLRLVLICLINKLTLFLLCPGLLLCGIFDVEISIWIRQRRGRASVLLELRKPWQVAGNPSRHGRPELVARL